MNTGILVAYFVKDGEAREALRKLRRKGYRRAAGMSKNADGEIHTWGPFRWSRIFGGARRTLLEDHARRLISGETVLILQAPIEELRIPVSVLERGEIPPAVFLLRPQRESPVVVSPVRRVPPALYGPARKDHQV